jgi:hypothetical protein
MAYALCMLNNYGYTHTHTHTHTYIHTHTHTHTMFNIYCLSTAKTVARTRFNLTFTLPVLFLTTVCVLGTIIHCSVTIGTSEANIQHLCEH